MSDRQRLPMFVTYRYVCDACGAESKETFQVTWPAPQRHSQEPYGWQLSPVFGVLCEKHAVQVERNGHDVRLRLVDSAPDMPTHS